MDAYATLDEKNKKAAALYKRRQKLQKLLSDENVVYQAELQNLSVGNYSRLHEMQEKYVLCNVDQSFTRRFTTLQFLNC